MKKLLGKFFEEQGFLVGFEKQIKPDAKVKKGEKVIGEMNDMEKRLFTFLRKKEEEKEQLIGKLKLANESGNEEELRKNEEELRKLRPEYAKIHRVIALARKIMWTSIESRIETSEEATGTGIRKEFEVVETYEEDCLSGHGMIIPGIGAIISLRV